MEPDLDGRHAPDLWIDPQPVSETYRDNFSDYSHLRRDPVARHALSAGTDYSATCVLCSVRKRQAFGHALQH